jgi:hypothetical protein
MGQQRAWETGWVSLLSFPDPVNEISARLVAAGVAVMSWPPLGSASPGSLCPSPIDSSPAFSLAPPLVRPGGWSLE